ncbi:ankyrin repeat domain-containing protein [Cognatishimia maritima]|uniref:Ankyrin repeat-containing protein n=1 Tax=Cognatishimia maritima TaxID=870908 RepID=A0A1M5J8G7_9RHOB|nr:ankyrin repeat domain-containing protein [Cognatishimia maritima]SHG36530.1 Ankyrin repeat-containing protein [Cognatishimia maritima]
MVRFLTSFVLALCLCPPAAAAEEIHLAARKGDAEALRQLLDAGVPIDQPSTKNTSQPGVTALYVAAQFGRIEAVNLLLEAGADPVIRPVGEDADGTPLHMAVRRGSTEIVKMFLDQGVDPNIYDRWQATPLHQARLRKNDDLANLLIAHGAETDWRAPPIGDQIANADLAAGEVVAKGCAGLCHTLEPGAELSLWGIVNSPKAARSGYQYSEALLSMGGDWTIEDLNSFIAAPGRFLPGTGMYYSAPNEQDRINLIAFLATTSEN